MRLLVASTILLLACGGNLAPPATSAPVRLPGKSVAWSAERAIDEAAAYLHRHVNEEGRFDYLRRSAAPERDYNLLRHGGTIYALLQYHQHKPSPRSAAAILRASRYLQRRYLRSPAGRPDLLAAFSRPDEESVETSTAKLGGTALALLALCGSHAIDKSVVRVEELQAMGRFILFMQREDGSFHSKYTEDGGYDTSFHSLYYPGEAMLALAALYEVDRDPSWLHASLRSAAQLVSSRKGVRRPPADHWMMIASAPLLQRFDEVEAPPISSEELAEHIRLLARLMLRHQQPGGALTRNARSTPTATRLEGLGALLRSQQRGGEPDSGLSESMRSSLSFLRRCQVKEPGPEQGGMPRSCSPDGESRRRDKEIRIDYVQHYLSAMLTARELGVL